MLESWKHCVASGCTEAAAANTEEEKRIKFLKTENKILFTIKVLRYTQLFKVLLIYDEAQYCKIIKY